MRIPMGSKASSGDPTGPEEECNSLLSDDSFGEVPGGSIIKPPRFILDQEANISDKQAKLMLSNFELFALASYWFGWACLMGPLLIAVIPEQIDQLTSGRDKGSALGDTLIMGSMVALIAAPLSGSFSDSSTHPWGRRSPFIATGIIVASVALLLMAIAPTLQFYSFAFLLLSAANNIVMSPYTALVPDLVPPEQRGTASAWLGVMSLLGTLIGGFVMYFKDIMGTGGVYLILGLIHAGSGVITIQFTQERPVSHNQGRAPSGICSRFCSLIRPMLNNDFRIMFFTRFLMQMGILTVQEYMLFYLKDAVREFTLFGATLATDAQQAVSIIFLPILVGSLGSACVAGMYADRTGKRKSVVYTSGVIMMLSCVLFSVSRYYSLALFDALVFGAGYGAFSVIEWAMATDLLPNSDEYAKDMGIWSLALVLPQVVAAPMAGYVLDKFEKIGPNLHLGYSMIYMVALLFFGLGMYYVKRIESLD